jgi:predicted phosphate transport protein (TIGR00153 family)
MRLLPRKSIFFDLFDEQAENLVTAAVEVRDLLHHFDDIAARQQRIKDLEHEGDQTTYRLVMEVHGTFVTPIDKDDILAITSGLDDVLDLMDAAAVRVSLYNIPESSPEARQLGDLLVQVTEVLRDSVKCLRDMKHRDAVISACREIHRLENESDAVYRRALGALFNTPGVDPIFVLKWKEIYERLEMAVDKCEDVSNVVEAIQIEYA